MTQYTPAPWKVDLETGEIEAADGQVVIGAIYGTEDYPCLERHPEDFDSEAVEAECNANARLVEAAPQMLALCREFVARTAIAWKVDEFGPTHTLIRVYHQALGILRQTVGTATVERLIEPQPIMPLVSFFHSDTEPLDDGSSSWCYQVAEHNQGSPITFNALHVFEDNNQPGRVGDLYEGRLITGVKIEIKDGFAYWQIEVLDEEQSA